MCPTILAQFYLVKINHILTQVFTNFKKNLQKNTKNGSKNPLAVSAPFLLTDENTQKNKVPMLLLAKIKWKTPWVCVKIENKCKRTEKNQNFRHNCPI